MKRTLRSTATLVSILCLIGATATVGASAAMVDRPSADAPLAAQETPTNETVSEEQIGNVTINNLGENVSVEAIEARGVTPEEPMVYVGPSVRGGPNATGGPAGLTLNVSQEYVLGGRVPGWVGAAPASINGTTNPTLHLTAGELYAFTWTNLDGARHNVAIFNASGGTVADTPIVSGVGASQTLVFRAPDEAGTYVCVVHPTTMQGNVTVAMNVTA